MDFQKIKHQASEFWQSRNRAQKIKIVASALIIVIVSSMMLYIISRPKYVTLYSNLDIKEAAEIVKKLEENNIPHKLEDEGKTILVDPEQKYKIRLMLAQEGLPKGGSIGFDEVFSQSRLGTTEWERRIQYNQALQGELSRAIEMMESVERAKIYIVQQEESLFIEPNSNYEPSAAVFLQVKPGHEMTKEEVRGIINLITYSVKNMKPENVTVVDQYGRTLSNIPFEQDEDSPESISNQLIVQNNFQNQLQANVQSLLEQVFGPGNVAVRVSAELNFDKKTVQNKLFTPVNEETGEGIVRSIQELREHFSGNGTAAGGEPGVGSNVVPGYAQVETGPVEQQRTEVIKNFDINETLETLTVMPGAVNRLTVSVVVNRELNEREKESIAMMVGNAIGYDPERDQISVEGMEFQNDMVKLFADEFARQQREQQRMRYFIIAGIALTALLAFIIIRTMLNRRKTKQEEEQLAEEMLVMQQAAAAKMEEESLETRDNDIYKKIERHARRNPEDVAKVIKTWLSED
ncbi:MAG TPA: flagellar M-ring protein FliF [Thermoanaerobacterales bacterium]|nr:flagellar M-ring protein FliF [Thermoanaerobacterales bacterium]